MFDDNAGGSGGRQSAKKPYKIAVVGDRESVLGFRAVGFSVFIADGAFAAGEMIRAIAEEGFAAIFLVEDYAVNMAQTLDIYAARPLPAIIVIPGKNGSSGFGMAQIKKSVERAVGADILFRDDE
ncbi:MAG: hypothetical protein FWG09_06785 [Synergistaceae bacterium]|nr:hypothetical protein [Synergistaceae bacterium]